VLEGWLYPSRRGDHRVGEMVAPEGCPPLEAVRGVQLEPQSEQALVAKAVMLGALGQIEEARTYCDRALQINHRNEQAWVNIGVALDALNRLPEALTPAAPRRMLGSERAERDGRQNAEPSRPRG
jgi:tetratricopeptide (TPR) repeat protein